MGKIRAALRNYALVILSNTFTQILCTRDQRYHVNTVATAPRATYCPLCSAYEGMSRLGIQRNSAEQSVLMLGTQVYAIVCFMGP